MTDLSPAAQAVLDAADDVYWDWADMSPASSSIIAAAALRAAAEELGYNIVYDDDDKDYMVNVADLLAIAAELEGAQ